MVVKIILQMGTKFELRTCCLRACATLVPKCGIIELSNLGPFNYCNLELFCCQWNC